ncbi:MAG: TIGR02266 family protein [Deltaproteobacteria bacterium]|nr:TIGR02266 family protein [Deltaproteobacteria bacterium]
MGTSGAYEILATEGERALAEVATRLVALETEEVQPPSCDPHAAAATALMVADFLKQPGVREKLGTVGLSLDDVTDLGRIARALLAVVNRIGGDYLRDHEALPPSMVERAEAVRTTISAALEKALPDDDDVKMWLAAVRLGSGVVDLVYDLRTLGDLCARFLPGNASGQATTGAVKAARTAAHAIEIALRDGEAPDMTKRRDALARLWTLFVPAYEKVAAGGRELAKETGEERHFPPLALVASHRRARRRPLSIVPPAFGGGASMRPPVAHTSLSPQMEVVGVDTVDEPIPEPPRLGDLSNIATPPVSIRPASAGERERVTLPYDQAAKEAAAAEGRRSPRHAVEIEVGFTSESNFYVGFTENLSATGVFVATYTRKPIGSTIEVTIALPEEDEIKVLGVVRWLRESTDDGWPGMGVRFEHVSPEVDAKLKRFLSLREPLFYDE